MNIVRYILAFIVGLFGAGIAFSGILSLLENLLGPFSLVSFSAAVLTIALGVWLVKRFTLSVFRQEKQE